VTGPLVSDISGLFGTLVVFGIILIVIGALNAASFVSALPAIAEILKSIRSSTTTNPNGTGVPGIDVISPGTRVVAIDPGSSFAQAFGASFQRSLGPQLGQTLGQLAAMAAAQHPLELQLAPLVMAIELARRQGNVASVSQFLTDRFASSFTAAPPGSAGISHMALASGSAVAGDHVVIRIDRSTGVAAHSEYWSFEKAAPTAPEGTPVVCPGCGAPTAGDNAGTCRFCGATFSTTAPALPQPTRWLLDDISGTPPALAA
jgi:hypothetical protein